MKTARTLIPMVLCAALVSRATAGSTPGADAFLLLPVNAREIGLGQATLAMVDDATAFHWNPGGLGMIGRFDAIASYSRLYRGLSAHQVLAAGVPVGHKLTVGLAWVRLGVDNIPRYPSLDVYGTTDERRIYAEQGAIGSFSYSQNAFLLTLARRNDFSFDMGWQYLTLPMTIPVGVTVKYLFASAGDTISASGIGADIGAQVHFPLSRALDNRALGTLSLGATLANVGRTRMTWDTPTKRADTQGMNLRYGIAYEQPLAFIRAKARAALVRTADGIAWGGEYAFMERIFLRVGRDMIPDNGLAFGAGLAWRGVGLDYALQRHPLGVTHRVSVHIRR